eukprot:1682796-Rhodomonas_salina.1
MDQELEARSRCSLPLIDLSTQWPLPSMAAHAPQVVQVVAEPFPEEADLSGSEKNPDLRKGSG